MPPPLAVYHAIGVRLAKGRVNQRCAVGIVYRVRRHMVYRIAPVRRQGQPADAAATAEQHGVLYQERLCCHIRLDVGTDKHKDAVACGNGHIPCHHARVPVYIQAEARAIPRRQCHRLQTHCLAATVIHLQLACGGAHLGEHRIKRHCVAREFQRVQTSGIPLFLLARHQHSRQQHCHSQDYKE